jgi:hypothetical protein
MQLAGNWIVGGISKIEVLLAFFLYLSGLLFPPQYMITSGNLQFSLLHESIEW